MSHGIMKMGCLCMSPQHDADETREQARKNKRIDKQIKTEREQFNGEHRLLLLGAGESGKSTILKQMVFLSYGFCEVYRGRRRIEIKRNVRDAMLAIVAAMPKLQPAISMKKIENEAKIDYLFNVTTTFQDEYHYDEEFFDTIQSLWNDPGVQSCYERSNEYQLLECAKYFLDKIQDIRQPDYTPTNQDIFRCRFLTRGIFELRFNIDSVRFHLFDVGGQREERRKWIQCFNDVTAIIFVVASSSYDMTLREEHGKNRICESLELFRNIWNNRWLKTVSVILFLNKQDLLEQKVIAQKSKLEDFFPEFATYNLPKIITLSKGENSEVTRAKYFIKDLFVRVYTSMSENHIRHSCYPHFTCAIDSRNIKRVFYSCRDVIKREHLRKFELI